MPSTSTNAANGAMGRWQGDRHIGVLKQRIISALVLIPIAVVDVLLGGWWFAGAVLLVSAILLHEWYQVTGAKALWAGTAALLAIWVAAAYHQSIGMAGYLLVMGAIGSAFLCLVRGGESVAGWAAAGLFYIAIPMISLVWVIWAPGGSQWVLWLLIVVWATDIAAFVIGRWIGGPKLAPRISPGKTWAGAAGGLVGGLIASVLAAIYILPLTIDDALMYAAVISIAAQLGDLMESWVKRRFQVKDSSTLIPGHGGLMDRVDGLIIAAPVLALIVAFSQPVGGMGA